MSALQAVSARHSWSKVTDAAPTHEQLLPLVAAASRSADHAELRPWRLIELRGADREALGRAIVAATGRPHAFGKPLRAPLLIAVVACIRPSIKVAPWEQEAAAAGVAHILSLLLDEAGWGVMWHSGHYTRSAPVARMHGLSDDERLMGWLYVGGKWELPHPTHRQPVDPALFLSPSPA